MSILLATYRSATAALADESDATVVDDVEVNGGGPLQDDVALAVQTTLTGTPTADEISTLVFKARAAGIVTGGATIHDAEVTWQLAFTPGTAAVSLAGSLAEVSSGPIPRRPDGMPWEWADVAALVNVGVTAFATLPSVSSATLRLSEIWVEVYGEDPTHEQPVTGSMLMGDLPGDLHSGNSEHAMLAGDLLSIIAYEAPLIDVGYSLTNLLSYATLQDAIDDTPSGGRLVVPARRYDRITTPQVVPATITRPIHIWGECATSQGNASGSRLVYKTGGVEDLASDLFTINGADWVTLDNLYIEGAGASGAGVGIKFTSLKALLMRRCLVTEFPSWAIKSGDGSEIVEANFEHVRAQNSKSNGILSVGQGTAACFYTKVSACNFIPTTGRAISLGTAQVTVIRDTVMQSSMADAADQEMIYANFAGGLNKLTVDTCWFEQVNDAETPTSWFIHLVGPTLTTTIKNCTAGRPGQTVSDNKKLRFMKTVASGVNGCFGLKVEDNMGDVGGMTSTGTDDIVLNVRDVAYLCNNRLRDTTSYNVAMSKSLNGATMLQDI
jgi:hypothetical protein